jgi:hypothetical protein
MPFEQRTNTSCYLAIPTHGFTVVLSVFWAHLLRSPLTVKSRLIHPARLLATCGQSPPAENLGSPAPFYVLCQVTSSRCRLCFVSQCYAFRSEVYFNLAWAIKNPASVAVSRAGNPMDPMIASPAYPKSIGVAIPGPMLFQA